MKKLEEELITHNEKFKNYVKEKYNDGIGWLRLDDAGLVFSVIIDGNNISVRRGKVISDDTSLSQMEVDDLLNAINNGHYMKGES